MWLLGEGEKRKKGKRGGEEGKEGRGTGRLGICKLDRRREGGGGA